MRITMIITFISIIAAVLGGYTYGFYQGYTFKNSEIESDITE